MSNNLRSLGVFGRRRGRRSTPCQDEQFCRRRPSPSPGPLNRVFYVRAGAPRPISRQRVGAGAVLGSWRARRGRGEQDLEDRIDVDREKQAEPRRPALAGAAGARIKGARRDRAHNRLTFRGWHREQASGQTRRGQFSLRWHAASPLLALPRGRRLTAAGEAACSTRSAVSCVAWAL